MQYGLAASVGFKINDERNAIKFIFKLCLVIRVVFFMSYVFCSVDLFDGLNFFGGRVKLCYSFSGSFPFPANN